MASTNISIKQQSSVSINVETLQAVIVETLQAIKQRVLSVTDNSSLFTLHSSLIRLYRQELRMARAVARVIDKHSVLASLWIIGWAAFIILYTFLYY